MSRKSLVALPIALAPALVGRRLVPGPLDNGTILLPSGWRIHLAGRQVTVGTVWGAFTSRPDLAPFAALPNRWALDEVNSHAVRSMVPARDLARPDAADETELNREIWASVRPTERLPPPRHAGGWPGLATVSGRR
jgi:hypothetical protein